MPLTSTKTRTTASKTEKTIEELLEAVKQLVDSDQLKALTSRGIAKKSGYSIGTIYRYFEKLDDIFIHLFIERRKLAMLKIEEAISSLGSYAGIHQVIAAIYDSGTHELMRNKNPKLLQFVVRYFFKNSKEPEKFNSIIDCLIPAIRQFQSQDKTGTVRLMSDEEIALNLRAMQASIRAPFLEAMPFAGSEEHRRLVLEIGVNLFGKRNQLAFLNQNPP